MPERPEQHRIDEAAQKSLRNILPDAWVIRPQNPDYGVDFLVEPFHADKASGLQIGVQLKGKKEVQIANGFAKCKGIKTDHLAYYLERDDPIFLVLVDTVKGAGWYLFLQKYTLEVRAGENWPSQKTITVYVPVANDLKNVDKFEADSWEARKYMATLRPGALEASVAAQEGLMESKDPRFKVRVKAAEGKIYYELQAREVVEFTIEFKGAPERIAALQHDLLNRGVPVALNPGDVELDGSPLLKHAFEQSGSVTVQASKGFNAKVLFRPVGPNGQFISHLEAPALVEGGLTEMRLHAELANAPFGADIRFELEHGKPSKFMNFSVLFALSRWVGRPVQHLPYFQDILAMFEAVAAGSDVRVDCLWEGNPVFGGRVANGELKGWLKVLPFLQTYEKAREMARHLKVNPPLPEKMTIDELEEIEDLHWRVWPGEHRVPGEGMEFNVHLINPDFEALFKQSAGPLVLKAPDEPVKFLRQTVSTGPVEYELTCPRIKQSIEELRASAVDGGVSVTFVGTEQSEVIVRRPSSTPSTSG